MLDRSGAKPDLFAELGVTAPIGTGRELFSEVLGHLWMTADLATLANRVDEELQVLGLFQIRGVDMRRVSGIGG